MVEPHRIIMLIQYKIWLHDNALSNKKISMREINVLLVLEHLFMFSGYLKKHSNDRNCMDISSFWFINAIGLSLLHKIFRVAIMPKSSDGIDNILIYLQDEKINYRAGTDMVGKVFSFGSHVMSNFLQYLFNYQFNGDKVPYITIIDF